jgi:hypothetical protein
MKQPTAAAKGSANMSVHVFVAMAPAIAAKRLNLKIDANTTEAAIPAPGAIPKKTPRAAPAAMLWGVSLIRKNCLKNFFMEP